jgi:hypothetical protein
VQSLDEAFKATNRLNAAINSVRKSLVVPFGDVFTPLINSLGEALTGMQPQVKAWATGVANDLKVIAQDLRGIFQGAAPQTDFGKVVVDGLNAIRLAITFVSAAWDVLVAAMQPVAAVLNAVFGTDYSARTYALGAAVIYLTGVIPALIAGFTLLQTALSFFLLNPVGQALTALGLIALTIYQELEHDRPAVQSALAGSNRVRGLDQLGVCRRVGCRHYRCAGALDRPDRLDSGPGSADQKLDRLDFLGGAAGQGKRLDHRGARHSPGPGAANGIRRPGARQRQR